MNTLLTYRNQIDAVTSALDSGDDAAFSLELAKLDSLRELQRDIVRTALAGDADHKALLIQTLKTYRVTKQSGILEELAARWGVDSAELMRALVEHFASAANQWHSAAQPYQLPSHTAALDAFIKSGRSGFIRAALGSGKTEKIAGGLVSLCKKIGVPVVAATVLKSLTKQLSKEFGLPLHRDDVREIEDANGCVTTIHGLDSTKLDGLFCTMRQLGGFVIIDEPSSVGELIFRPNAIVSHDAQTRIICKLKHLAQNGVRFLLLDGDITPCALQLAKLVGADGLVLESTEQPHAQPHAIIWPQTFVTDTTTGKRTQTRPRLHSIIQLLQSGERVAIGCTSARYAKQIHRVLTAHCSGKSILIHGGNTDEPEQAGFLADANASASKYQLCVYSPSLSQGFSVTSIEAHVFIFATCNTLNPAALWQLARRFRRAVGAVNFVCNTSQQRDQWHAIPFREEIEQDYQILIGQHGGSVSNPVTLGRIAADYQNALAQRNPTNALAGHLFNLGVRVDFKFCDNVGNAQESKQAAREISKADIQRIATAPHTDPMQARELARAAKATEQQQAQVRRAEIEANLLLTTDDHEPDGTLPLEIVSGCERDKLESKVKRLALVQSGVQFDSNQRNNYQGAQVEIMRGILAEMTGEDGQIIYNQRAAERIADQFRSQIRIAYNLIPQAPRRTRGKPPKVYAAQVSEWLTRLLSGWGFHRRKIGTEKTNRNYSVKPCKEVDFYAQRWVEIHMHANGLKPLRQ